MLVDQKRLHHVAAWHCRDGAAVLMLQVPMQQGLLNATVYQSRVAVLFNCAACRRKLRGGIPGLPAWSPRYFKTTINRWVHAACLSAAQQQHTVLAASLAAGNMAARQQPICFDLLKPGCCFAAVHTHHSCLNLSVLNLSVTEPAAAVHVLLLLLPQCSEHAAASAPLPERGAQH